MAFNIGNGRISHSRNYLPTAKVEHYHVTIDKNNFFDEQLKIISKHDNIWKIKNGQKDN